MVTHHSSPSKTLLGMRTSNARLPRMAERSMVPFVRELELRSFLVTSHCYLSPRMYLRPKPRWNTRIAIVDGAAATHRVHRTLGTQPPAKRVRFKHQTAIRPIPSCKEASTGRPDLTTHTPTTQVLAVTTKAFLHSRNNQMFTRRKPTSTAHSTQNPNPRIARVGSSGNSSRWLPITGRF